MSKDKSDYRFTVWVGGTEINEYYLLEEEAIWVSKYWKDQGYDDVYIEEVSIGNT